MKFPLINGSSATVVKCLSKTKKSEEIIIYKKHKISTKNNYLNAS